VEGSAAVDTVSRRLLELADQLPVPAADGGDVTPTAQLAEQPHTDAPVALDAPRRNRPGRVYQILTDRGRRGDPDTYADRAPRSEYLDDPDAPAGSTDYDPYDPTDAESFHGGDLAGLTEMLDHFEGMGLETVWISPVPESRTTLSFGEPRYTGAG